MSDKKPRRPRAETPKGFRDYFGHEVTERAEMLAKIAEVYRQYGFEALETSAVETVEALGKFLPDVDRPNEGVFAWQEEDKDWLALRYDLTAPLARVYAQHRATLPTPYRRYAMGPVWRNEKPGPGRFRQFYQCDADTVGTPTVAADAEIVKMLCDAIEAAGIARGDYRVRVGNRKILNGVLEVAGVYDPLNPEWNSEKRGIVLRAIDKIDRLGVEGVMLLLGPGRKDASGDFTAGANLSSHQIATLMRFVNAEATIEQAWQEVLDGKSGYDLAELAAHPAGRSLHACNYLYAVVGESAVGREGVDEVLNIMRLGASLGLSADQITVDSSVVRGLGYYTGPVFEAELTFETLGDDGKPRQFGSVAGGGRYDDLVKRFTGEAVPATGVSIGVDRLLAALRARAKTDAPQEPGPIVVTVMDRDRMADTFALVAELRAAGLRAEPYLGNPKNFGAQLKYADRRHAPFAIIEGSDEKARGVVQVKDLVAGAKAAETATLEEWKDRPAQSEVRRENLVAHLKRLLAT